MSQRTIWQLLAEAVAGLPEPFGRADVLAWFALHYPSVNPDSVSTHLQYATSNAGGTTQRGPFAHREPLVTRLRHGVYVRYREGPVSRDPTPQVSADQLSVQVANGARDSTMLSPVDVALVGCGRAKRTRPSPAADLYVGHPFRLRRALAEIVANEWFVLSAEYGLLEPSDWAAPYDLRLQDTTPGYRQAWGGWCVERLEAKAGPLRDKSVMVIAPAPYADAVRGPLRAKGAEIAEPLAGLRQGEQIQWLARQVAPVGQWHETGPVEARPAARQGPKPEPDGNVGRDQAIADALLAYGATHTHLHESRLGFAETAEADQLLQHDPFAFLLGVVFDEGIKAERAWQAPFELRVRLGHLDPERLRHEQDAVRVAIAQRPSLHRYIEIMAVAVVRAAARVCARYRGNAAQIWKPGSSASEVDARLQAFHRIGPKKAAMAVELLITQFGVDLAGYTGTSIAYDVHVRRVFLRTGLVETDSYANVTQTARRLNPARPGLLDLPTWLIGRRWCRPDLPDCGSCPLGDSCRKLTKRNIAA